jgi:hypothetical protein
MSSRPSGYHDGKSPLYPGGALRHHRATMGAEMISTWAAVLIGCVLSAALGFFLDV